MRFSVGLPIVLLSAAVLCLAAPTSHIKHSVGFAADPSINAAGIFAAARNSRTNILATFRSSQDSGYNVDIFGDWKHLHGVSAIHFTADMDVDCDGVDFKCPHNPDGQEETSFGRLAATKVPFYVLPLEFSETKSSLIKPNALGAIICNGRMFYGIFGDESGPKSKMIGEGSILLAQTCFPKAGLDGGRGHDEADVLYVVFLQQVPRGVGQETIDIKALKKLGDRQARNLAYALGV